jgi:hypothetical protein
MANTTGWIGGRGAGLTWTNAFGGGDLSSLANGSSVLSSAADVGNGSALDMYADFMLSVSISGATPPSGAFIGLYIYPLVPDAAGGNTYGDGQFSSGTQIAAQPAMAPAGTIPLRNAALTLLSGMVQGILLPPGSFRFLIYNASGIAFGTTWLAQYRTYDVNLNS